MTQWCDNSLLGFFNIFGVMKKLSISNCAELFFRKSSCSFESTNIIFILSIMKCNAFEPILPTQLAYFIDLPSAKMLPQQIKSTSRIPYLYVRSVFFVC